MGRGQASQNRIKAAQGLAKQPHIKLWLDDKLDEAENRKTPPGWTPAKTADAAQAILETGEVYCASFDHDLGDENARSGYDLVKWMCEFGVWPPGGVSIHSDNSVGVRNMSQLIERYSPYGRPSPDRRHFQGRVEETSA